MPELPGYLRGVYTTLVPRPLRGGLERVLRGPYPRVFDRRRFVFVHIPTTGAKSRGRVTGVRGAGHLAYRDYEDLIGERLRDYFVFTVVREPLERLRSSYAYLDRGGNGSRDDRELKRRWLDPQPDFDAFVCNVLPNAEVFGSRKFKPQADYLLGADGRLPAALRILRYESLDEDFRHVAARLGLDPTLPRVNVTRRGRDRLGLSPQGLARVMTLYRRDYELFGYPPPQPR